MITPSEQQMTWTTQDYVYIFAECVVSFLSVMGNTVVLLAIWKTPGLHTVTNCFIGSLAAADVLVGIVTPPTAVLPYRGLPKNFYGCVFLNSLVVLITNISILNLLAIALERFLAISDPFSYMRLMTKTKAMAVIVITWTIGSLLGLVPLMGWNHGQKGFTVCSFPAVICMEYVVYLIFFVVNILPLVLMLAIYLYIFHIVRKQQRRFTGQVMTNGKGTKQERRQVRGAIGLAYVIILYAVCWIPIHIIDCVVLFAPEKKASKPVLLTAVVLSHSNSAVNPYLYALSNSGFKRAMIQILGLGRLQDYFFRSGHSVYEMSQYPTALPLRTARMLDADPDVNTASLVLDDCPSSDVIPGNPLSDNLNKHQNEALKGNNLVDNCNTDPSSNIIPGNPLSDNLNKHQNEVLQRSHSANRRNTEPSSNMIPGNPISDNLNKHQNEALQRSQSANRSNTGPSSNMIPGNPLSDNLNKHQ